MEPCGKTELINIHTYSKLLFYACKLFYSASLSLLDYGCSMSYCETFFMIYKYIIHWYVSLE